MKKKLFLMQWKNIQYAEKLNKFWDYFVKYWMPSNQMIESWNISNYQGNKNVLRRTNNGLERYNLRMKTLFKNGRPSFAQFVHTMRQESQEQQKIAEDHMNQAAKKKEPKLMKMMETLFIIHHHVGRNGNHHQKITEFVTENFFNICNRRPLKIYQAFLYLSEKNKFN